MFPLILAFSELWKNKVLLKRKMLAYGCGMGGDYAVS
jgi:hypothetical protein